MHKSLLIFFGLVVAAKSTMSVVPVNWPGYYPEWWYEADLIDESKLGVEEGNHSPVLLGQLKHFASKARDELDNELAPIGGAGSAINSLVDPWLGSPVDSSNFAASNLGQIKNSSMVFFDRLHEVHYPFDTMPGALAAFIDETANGHGYPWGAHFVPGQPGYDEWIAMHKQVAVLGQAKLLYSWNIQAWTSVDADFDNLPDWWEMYHFGNLDASSGLPGQLTDSDDDGFKDYFEYLFHSNANDDQDKPGNTLPKDLSTGDEDQDLVDNEVDADPYDPAVGALSISIISVSN